MFDKILQWLYNTFDLGKDDDNEEVDVAVAIENYQKYQDELKTRKDEYIKTIGKEIKSSARYGKTHLTISDLPDELDSYIFVQEIKSTLSLRVSLLKLNMQRWTL